MRLISELGRHAGAPWGGLAAGTVLGVLWAFATYAAASAAATWLGEAAPSGLGENKASPEV